LVTVCHQLERHPRSNSTGDELSPVEANYFLLPFTNAFFPLVRDENNLGGK
jgi:hypothetical protein